VTFYELLSGRTPFCGPIEVVIFHTLNTPPPPLRNEHPEIPAALEAICLKALSKRPEERYASCREVAKELGGWLAGRPTSLELPAKAVGTRVEESGPAATPGSMAKDSSSLPPTILEALGGAESPSLPTVRRSEGRHRPPRRWMTAAAAALLLSLLGVVLFIITNYATVRTELSDPSAQAEERVASDVTPARPRGPLETTNGHASTNSAERVGDETIFAARSSSRPAPTDTITNSIGMRLTLVPAGEFLMGSPPGDGDDHEHPPHRVRITRPFSMGIHEVTRGQFRRFVDETGYQTEAERDGRGGDGWNEEAKKFEQGPRYTWQHPGFEQTDEHPVVNVSWNDAAAFAAWLSRKEGKIYRLPTEAEWEYGCRAGTTSRYSIGDDPLGLAAVANIADGTAQEKHPDWTWAIAARDGYISTAPVGRLQPNRFGLYDMHGNVREWCSDGYSANYYEQSPVDDPPGAVGVSLRVSRGGGWYDVPHFARSALRIGYGPEYRHHALGFRLARVPSPAEPESITTRVGAIKLKRIPAGTFLMGAPETETEARPHEKPQHTVRITRSFYLCIYEVTQAQYQAVMGQNPSWFSRTGGGKAAVGGRSTDQHPVESLSWLDAVRFCNTLSEREGLKPIYKIEGEDVQVPDWLATGYRLPTEAEWEYACRAGSTTRYCFGDNEDELSEYAWFGGDFEKGTHAVGQKRPNAWGLYDMHGSLWEFCWDRASRDASYSEQELVTDPTGPPSGTGRVFRGGAVDLSPKWLRSALRSYNVAAARSRVFGLRLARTTPDT
jgi:formylglycine-generating enzyme required for sulfatase activity